MKFVETISGTARTVLPQLIGKFFREVSLDGGMGSDYYWYGVSYEESIINGHEYSRLEVTLYDTSDKSHEDEYAIRRKRYQHISYSIYELPKFDSNI